MKSNAPKVVKKPTGKVGGSNKKVTPVKSPTKYTGGKNPSAKVSPRSCKGK